MKSNKIDEVWNGANSLFKWRFWFVVIQKFAIMASWRNDFSSLLVFLPAMCSVLIWPVPPYKLHNPLRTLSCRSGECFMAKYIWFELNLNERWLQKQVLLNRCFLCSCNNWIGKNQTTFCSFRRENIASASIRNHWPKPALLSYLMNKRYWLELLLDMVH